jgi:hypothetical protein
MALIRLTQLDGKLPNLALMALSHHHRARGDEIRFYRSPFRHLDEPQYDRVYGSAIFKFSHKQIDHLSREFPGAIIGGTGSTSNVTIEETIGTDSAGVDYSLYSEFAASIRLHAARLPPQVRFLRCAEERRRSKIRQHNCGNMARRAVAEESASFG